MRDIYRDIFKDLVKAYYEGNFSAKVEDLFS
jgi:hypothetical protein